MSKNAPCARRPSGQTVSSSPDPRTSPKPPRAGMIVLPVEVVLMLMSVIVLPFLSWNHFARRFLLVHVFLVPTTLGAATGGGSELATQRGWQSSPPPVSHAGHWREPTRPPNRQSHYGRAQPAVTAPRRRRRHLLEFLRDFVAPLAELAGLSGNVISSVTEPFTDDLNLRGFVVPGAFALGLIPFMSDKY